MNHLSFNDITPEKRKTKIYEVYSTYGDRPFLGQIRWHSAWRCYVFVPGETVWSWDCLHELSEFIRNMMEERKNKKIKV